MNSPKYIYNLISFSQSHIDAWDKVKAHEDSFDKAIKGMDRDDRRVFIKKWKEENLTRSFDPDTLLGKSYRGSFLDLDALIKIIEAQDDPYGICECYYTYLMIERRRVDCIDDITCFDKEGEIWYKMNEDDRYVRIEKPDCFRQTCNFT